MLWQAFAEEDRAASGDPSMESFVSPAADLSMESFVSPAGPFGGRSERENQPMPAIYRRTIL